MKDLSTPSRILVIQLRRIGDVILTTPAIAALKKRYPAAAIDLLVEAPGAQAVAGNPHLRDILVYDAHGPWGALSWVRSVRRRRYDWVIDFLGTPRSAIVTAGSGALVKAGPAHVSHRWAYNLKLVQSTTAHYGALEKIRVLKPLGVPSEHADFMPKLYFFSPSSSTRNVVGLVPASRKVTRQWPAASYAALGRMLRERCGCELLVFWGPGEKALAEEVARGIGDGARITPETKDLRAAAGLMHACRLIVTNCNGPKHMAVALGVPTVTIHGSSDPVSWNPPHPKHLVVRLDELHCIGCGRNVCPYQLECMKNLSAQTVFAAAQGLLAQVEKVS